MYQEKQTIHTHIWLRLSLISLTLVITKRQQFYIRRKSLENFNPDRLSFYVRFRGDVYSNVIFSLMWHTKKLRGFS